MRKPPDPVRCEDCDQLVAPNNIVRHRDTHRLPQSCLAYLAAFDRALKERTPEAWATMHSLAPAKPKRSQSMQGHAIGMARLLEDLEEAA